MKSYIGTKIIKAEPLTVEEYNKAVRPLQYFGDSQDGYLINEEGYVSWMPKSAFEKAYRQMDGLSFGLALEAAKIGNKIARKGWNGKGMFVVYQKGYPNGIPCNEQTAKAWGINEGDTFKCEPYLQIKMVNGSHAMWVPSINDCLADDWTILE